MSLVETWITATNGRGINITAAVEELNRETDGRYTLSRVGEWRRGVRQVPSKARSYMLIQALPVALEKAGFKKKSFPRKLLAELLT